MKLFSKIKILLLVLAFAFTLVQFDLPQAEAGVLDEIKDLFQVNRGDQGLSFTQYEGELTQLEAEGFNEALTESSNLREFVIRIVRFALGFLGLVAVIIFIYSGWLYVVDAGNGDNPEKAKKGMINATIGILIIMGSYAFVNTIIQAGGGDSQGGDRYVVGANTGSSFNASAIQVGTIAKDIYQGFILFAEAVEEMNGIFSDLEKDTLNFQRGIVSKENMLKFLYSAKEKLSNLRSRFLKFSAPYTRINAAIRRIDRAIDSIKNKSLVTFAQADGNGGIIICHAPGSIKDIENASIVQATYVEADITFPFPQCEGLSLTPYTQGTFTEWTLVLDDLNNINSSSNLESILTAIKEQYLSELTQNFQKLITIRQSLSSIIAVESGEIGQIYEDMRAEYGFDTNGEIDLISFNDSFAALLTELTLDNYSPETFDQIGRKLFSAVEKQLQFSELLSNLQGVQARLRANVVTGSAPLTVTFDVLESIDPAGGAIIDSSVDWSQIDGSATFDGQIPVDVSEAVTCNNQPQLDQQDEEVFGPAYRQCTFKYPGTYTATVRVQSNDPSRFVSGVSSLLIKVEPPKTKINLDLRLTDETISVMEYYDNGILKTDQNYIPVTLSKAKAGIQFDASGTANVENYNWNFGLANQEYTNEPIQNIEFEAEGRYPITLEVTNRLGEVDRKTFVLDVRNIAARISVTPQSQVFINDTINIDASKSASDSGTIRAYQWNITKISSAGNEALSLGNDQNAPRLSYQFSEPGRYRIELTVTNELSQSEAEPYFLQVQSRPPVALFSYQEKRENTPNIYQFNASESYDPDGSEENLQYSWTISPAQGWQWENGGGSRNITEKNPQIKFSQTGEYEVTLKVTDLTTLDVGLKEESHEITKTINVDNILDIDFAQSQQSTAQILNNGFATMTFYLQSDNAIAYEIDYGDGESDSGNMAGTATVQHTYDKAGRYQVEVTAYDRENFDNSVSRRILIGDGQTPIAKASLIINGETYEYNGDPIIVNKKDNISFDASASQNIDGTGRDLRYSWNFGDTKTSTKRITKHSYDELSPQNPGYYTAKLTVTDADNPLLTDTDEIRIDVQNSPPTFSSVQGIISAQTTDLVTPVVLDMKAYEVSDPDGQVVQYKWWYFDVDDPEEQLGVLITKNPDAKLTIGTRGQQGQEITYGFGLEITDNDGLTYQNSQAIEDGNFSSITVTNGQNDLPEASFDVNATSVFTGDKVVFTSSSKDSDGSIQSYIWDIEGDGFYNNVPTQSASIEHTYTEKNLSGYSVRLKVIDDKGGESVSKPIKVYVDSASAPPEAAFTYQVVRNTDGMEISFKNNSTVDTASGASVLSYQWDFDTNSSLPNSDSDGDGRKDNDSDSILKNPVHLYPETGQYSVKLTVTDNQGNSDSVTNRLTIPLADPPVAAFTYQVIGDQVIFQNNSQADDKVGATIVSYKWDFDTESNFVTADSDGDGFRNNDLESDLENPSHKYNTPATYFVKLTVTDSQGNQDDVTNEVDYIPNADQLLNPRPSNPSLQAKLTSDLVTSDNTVYLQGESGRVRLNFALSEGEISRYVIDKNIYQDSDNNGITDDDADFISFIPGTWTTNFQKSWGQIVVKLTIFDQNELSDSGTLEIKFN